MGEGGARGRVGLGEGGGEEELQQAKGSGDKICVAQTAETTKTSGSR